MFDDVPGGYIQNDYGDITTYKGVHFSSTLDWIPGGQVSTLQ
jgi:hypothetical protein